jgi:hypothetical protein
MKYYLLVIIRGDSKTKSYYLINANIFGQKYDGKFTFNEMIRDVGDSTWSNDDVRQSVYTNGFLADFCIMFDVLDKDTIDDIIMDGKLADEYDAHQFKKLKQRNEDLRAIKAHQKFKVKLKDKCVKKAQWKEVIAFTYIDEYSESDTEMEQDDKEEDNNSNEEDGASSSDDENDEKKKDSSSSEEEREDEQSKSDEEEDDEE